MTILKKMDFQLMSSSIVLVIEEVANLTHQGAVVTNLAKMIFEYYTAVSWNYLCNAALDVACAVLASARYSCNKDGWTEDLKLHTHLSPYQFKVILKHVYSYLPGFHLDVRALKLRNKFKQSKFACVGGYVFPSSLNYCDVTDTIPRIPVNVL